MTIKQFLQLPILNGWNLFWLIFSGVSVLLVLFNAQANMHNIEEIKELIRYSVRAAVPWFLLAFGASTIHYLWPSDLSRWNLRNRRILGLSFAATMMWQLVFLGLALSMYGWDFFITQVIQPGGLVNGAVLYLIIFAMTITSFEFGCKLITAKQWKLLHGVGINILWLPPWIVYFGMLVAGQISSLSVLFGAWSTMIMMLKLYVMYIKRKVKNA